MKDFFRRCAIFCTKKRRTTGIFFCSSKTGLEVGLLATTRSFENRWGAYMSRRVLWGVTIVLALLIILSMSSVASAGDITWKLSAITSDGATAYGSLVYNANTGLYSSINVVTLAGTAFPGSNYTVVDNPFFGPAQVVIMANNSLLAGTPVLDILFENPLTNGGGVDDFLAYEGICNVGCTAFYGDEPIRYLEGSVSATPEPSSLLLFGTSLLGLAPLRRKLFGR
jgi:hypothetical protein